VALKLINYLVEESERQSSSSGTSIQFSRNIFDVYKDELDDDSGSDSSNDGSESDGVNKKSSMSRTLSVGAVAVVAVAGLPRDAVVEVECEVLSKRFDNNEDIISRRFDHRFSSSGTLYYSCDGVRNSDAANSDNSKTCDILGSSSNYSGDFRNWPIWAGQDIRKLYSQQLEVTSDKSEVTSKEVGKQNISFPVEGSSDLTFIVDEGVSSVDRCAYSSSVNVVYKPEIKTSASISSCDTSCIWTSLSCPRLILNEEGARSLSILSDASRVAGLVIGARSRDKVVNIDLHSSTVTIRVYIPLCYGRGTVVGSDDVNSNASNELDCFQIVTSAIELGFYNGLRSSCFNKPSICSDLSERLDNKFPLIVVPVEPCQLNSNTITFQAICVDITQIQSEMFVRGF
jgi:hypothetical protein